MENHDIRDSLSELIDDIALHTNTRYDDDIRAWLMGAALRIWAGNQMFAGAYVQALEALNGETYSTAQVITAMGCAGEKNREMDIPLFFQEIVRHDGETRTSHSRAIADSIGRFLAEMASINGDFPWKRPVRCGKSAIFCSNTAMTV